MKDDNREALLPDREPDEGGGSVDGECVLVPEGDYELRYIDYETAKYYGNPKVIVHYAICAPEEYAGLPVDRFYQAKALIGPPGRFGKYKAKRRGHLVREFHKLIGHADRLDRISFARLKGKRIIGDIQTVRSDHNRNPLPEEDQYSRISRLVAILPHDDW